MENPKPKLQNDFALLLVGRPKSGKTNVAFTFPNILYYDLDMNLESAIRRHPEKKDYSRVIIDYDITTGNEVPLDMRWAKLVQHLEASWKDPKYKTIVVDGLTKVRQYLCDFLVSQPSAVKDLIIGGQKMMTQSHWGPYAVLLQRFISGLRRIDKYIICCSHIHDDKDDATGRWFTKPAIGGQSEDTLPGIFTDVWQCEARPSAAGADYYVRTVPTAQMVLGNTLELLPEWKFDFSEFKRRLDKYKV